MRRLILLDTGILGMLTYPRKNPGVYPWLQRLRQAGVEVRMPEIADYEIRRELLRRRNITGIRRLDRLKTVFGYAPITTEAMLQAAAFWAQARALGRPTADPKELDADVILAAQASQLASRGWDVVIATTNVAHLSLFVAASRWEEIV